MSKESNSNSNVIAAGLALFSMFFGAGDLIWPLILGGSSGDQTFFSMLGLLVTGVTLPLLGLIAMMLYEGNYRAFFANLGRVPGFWILFIIQAILGPVGSIPRLITLSYATLKPYLFSGMTLLSFSVCACIMVFFFTIRKQRLIEILGLVLTPVLLLSLGCILVLGFVNHPAQTVSPLTSREAFMSGLSVGYNTLDLIASFIFAPVVLAHFVSKENDYSDPLAARRRMFRKMLKASLLAAFLLCTMYIGLTHVASYYTPYLDPQHLPEERLSGISLLLLGNYGALISCVAVAMTCLTTAIPLVMICADYIHKDLMREKGHPLLPLVFTLFISGAIANMGFMGIASMLSPVLQVLCPGLIVLSMLNIMHKLYDVHPPKVPVFAAIGLSTVGYLA